MSLSYKDFMSEPGARQYSTYIAMVCPFHDDHSPSLLVRDGGYKCMACGAKGSLKKLKDKLSGAVTRPAQETTPAGRVTPYVGDVVEFAENAHYELSVKPQLIGYLHDRGVDGMLTEAMLGFHDGWYIIPVTNRDRDIVGVTMRAGPVKQRELDVRFGNPVGQTSMLYVPSWRLFNNPDADIFVVFGIFDALAMASAGYAAVTTVGGKHTFRDEWLASERRRIWVIPDQGEERDAARLAASLGWRGRLLKLKYPDGAKDVADLAAAGLLKEYIEGGIS